VHWLQRDRLHDQEVERALKQICWLSHSTLVSTIDRTIP
jgi:hypothetical protein